MGAEFTQTQSLLDPVAAAYQHTLSSDSPSLLVGNFTCVVRDAAGNTDSQTLNLRGESQTQPSACMCFNNLSVCMLAKGY